MGRKKVKTKKRVSKPKKSALRHGFDFLNQKLTQILRNSFGAYPKK